MCKYATQNATHICRILLLRSKEPWGIKVLFVLCHISCHTALKKPGGLCLPSQLISLFGFSFIRHFSKSPFFTASSASFRAFMAASKSFVRFSLYCLPLYPMDAIHTCFVSIWFFLKFFLKFQNFSVKPFIFFTFYHTVYILVFSQKQKVGFSPTFFELSFAFTQILLLQLGRVFLSDFRAHPRFCTGK